ncbi:MAG: MinD/ParA family protein [Phycisphaeraceae bacterium]
MATYQDQASELRKLMQGMSDTSGASSHDEPAAAAGPRARIMAVTSGKGGVGKTNLSVNLAVRLATMGRRVVLLDADLGLANADVLLNLSIRANLAHVIAGRKNIDQAMVEAPGGFTLVPGASGLAQMANLAPDERRRLMAMMRDLATNHDLVIIDTGAGIGPNVLSFLLAADELLVVTTPEPTSITDAYALIKAVARQRENIPVSLLVNMVRDRAEGRQVYERINAVCKRFLNMTLSDAGHVVSDARVPQGVRRRTPFIIDTPDAPASLCIGQLAHKLDRHAAEPRGRGFFRNMASWLGR